ncbi:N-acetylmuramoyl-L-alanine amidase CwlD [Paenibacillus apiarius]|uniref:N-acetylmuramoyl-L-alanine amidase CwlD n=1 Tax=Paenibacillus apiarius TaxID=46240 RepID=A0ABT4DTH8_9BACL|nr:N-acetylmuramoyl-L-alanine amidase CwlD [Paenibacillus apiarius]MBN3523711.1 N-acetylmuramoyl-L-alanine amidase CwlD [Paenibacillus apiarius]MCY9516305.1 N-acetylmuramoyl-L-alanine amidase CwlD [Paenibacillus apiarius]MCY9520642.1 N-acetylmuramoyl-L-alanine amidase CwlD [Paenibacillus apiarius]MCY9552497.1 N-acetylmuramoyl-L-alanine amidase CwlD [Paenibacillus apiarius]MCY9561029.1 N-acetylmuramoyl-L-alanine amidase CwlD [Paenibacillus apiarius]
MSEKKQRKTSILWIPLRHVRQWVISVCLVLLVIVIMTADMPVTKTWTYWTIPLSGKIIAIDAGHGGPDGGAVSRQGVIEKDINLSIALYLRDYLQQAGAVVFMTREGDYDLANQDTKGYSKRKSEDLKQRVRFVEEKKADLLISLHMNSIPSQRWNGAQTFYTERNPESERLAKWIQAEIRRNLENTDRVAKPVDRRLYLMDQVSMPTALVEVGFLSNPEESRKLADEQYQRKVAASVYKGILRFMAGEKIGKR